jgi:hypothetical protein
MTKIVLAATATAVALSAGGIAFAAKPVTAFTHHARAHQVSRPAIDRSLGVLYDQSNNDSGISTVSQNFESTFAAYDAQAADDFTVPANTTWLIREVDVMGVYFNGSGPAISKNVYFYKDKKGLPGRLVAEYDFMPGYDNSGSFVIRFSKSLKLKAGKYWLSVVANMPFFMGGEWGWENQSTSEGSSAVWRNPGDGFATGCTNWTRETVCIPNGQGDHMFTLRGKSR